MRAELSLQKRKSGVRMKNRLRLSACGLGFLAGARHLLTWPSEPADPLPILRKLAERRAISSLPRESENGLPK
jgi:hypothetical protein